MRVLAPGEHMQLLVHTTPSGFFGSIPLHRELDGAFRMFLQQLVERDGLDTADGAGVMVVNLVGELATVTRTFSALITTI